jgi:uncharacterized YigZ family protein
MTSEKLLRVAGEGLVEILVRKSRFLGVALPCEGEATATTDLERLRALHPKANHHVYAWRHQDLETRLMRHRFDDDGEPGGTAGRPVLAALEGRQIGAGLVVVIRYFGGIKLGAGGLVRAYGEAAGKALAAAALQPIVRTCVLTVRLPFAHVPWLERAAAREGLAIVSRAFEADATIALAVPEERRPSLAREIIDQTGGAARIEDE